MALLPKLKLKTVPTFPANIIGGTGLASTKQNGAITLDFAWQEFGAISAIPTSPTSYLLTYDTATGVYVMVPSHLLGGGVAGISDAPPDGTQYGRQSGGWTPVVSSSVAPGTATPLMDGVAAVGTSLLYARQDHKHPTDTSLLPPAPAAVAPLMDGTAAVGTSLLYARQDHKHPTDTTLLPLAGGAMTGAVSLYGNNNNWKYVGGQGAGAFYDTASVPGRFFFGTDGSADNFRFWSHTGSSFFDIFTVTGSTGAIDFPNVTTAITQAAADNSTKLATTAFVKSAISGSGSVANPSATIGLTAINGSSVSAIRSDGAPALSQAIAPTWTSRHIFNDYIFSSTAAYLPTFTASDPKLWVVHPGESFALSSSQFYTHVVAQTNRVGGTGNREAFKAVQFTSAATTPDQIVGGILLAQASAGTGAIYGGNSYTMIQPGCGPAVEAISFEVDVDCQRAPNVKIGMQIIDVASSVGSGVTIDAGLIIAKQAGAVGFVSAIEFGRGGSAGIPILSGGTLIHCTPTTQSIRSGIDFEAATNFAIAPIILPPSMKGIYWGASKQGGAIVSETGGNAGDIVFANAATAVRFDGQNVAVYNRKAGGGAGECYLNFYDGANFYLRRVIVNGPDSGGAGFRSVKVEN